jgi:hypothetical protein
MDHNMPQIHHSRQQLRVPYLLIAALARVPHSSQSHRDEWDNRASDPLSLPRRKYLLALAILIAATLPAQAQWDIQDSHTTASLRGIHNVGGGVAWASGTEGTVLRTEDGGYLWQTCATPPGAEKLDFRGIQAFDENTAIVMSSGKGDLSRLYKTTDGCRTWKLLFTNPDKEGFWDAMQAENSERAFILGDSVSGELRVWEWKEGWEERELELSYEAQGKADQQEGSFAASNSVFQIVTTEQVDKKWKYHLRWASNTADHSYMTIVRVEQTATCEPCVEEKIRTEVQLANGSKNAGTFSFAFRTDIVGVAVGGDYGKPNSPIKTAAVSSDGGLSWELARQLPHGYRSAVAYDEKTKTWITVGPNGTDISRDDGRNWSPLKPTPTEPQDADKNWNALLLPFVVGPHGRIGKLRDNAIPTAASSKEEKDKKD